MSFAIKEKRKKLAKSKENDNAKLSKKIKETENEELASTSKSKEENGAEQEEENFEDKEETPQEKRFRLAKMYLQEIEEQEKELVAKKLREDYLKKMGKIRRTVADQYTDFDINYINIIQCKDHYKSVTCICVSADDKFIFSGGKDSRVVKWSLSERKKLSCIPYVKESVNLTAVVGHSHSIICIAISDDFKFLAVGDESNTIEIWDPETLNHIHSFNHHRDSPTDLVFQQNSHNLYSCSKDRTVKVWTLDEMSYLETLFGHQDAVFAIDALYGQRTITAGGMDSTIRIWNIPEKSHLIFNVTGTMHCVKFMNPEYFISGGTSGTLYIWGSKRKRPLCAVEYAHGLDKNYEHSLWITSLACLVNTDLVASGSSDGLIRLWKVYNICKSISPLFTIPAEGFVNSLQFTSNGNYLVAGIGREHRCGRWTTIKTAKNGIMIIPLLKSN